MRVKAVVDEDFTNYKVPSMFIGTISCGGKCCSETGIPLSACQNDAWRSGATIDINDFDLCKRYVGNRLTGAIVFGGLELFEQFEELEEFIHTLRYVYGCMDDIVIYTGYYPDEISEMLAVLRRYRNVVVKFGRFIPDQEPVYDSVLGVRLASPNQYAERIS